ncbi:MAG: N-acetylornithine carbamoyltransferase [Cryomorphaceae bacterium]|nr:MAG: N-acetylornithine carbamoyltransferase [Cryomorphaceae bacterium]
MKNFINSDDISDYKKIVEEAIQLKSNPNQLKGIGKNKSIGLLFFNPSLRTRISTQKASMILGLKTFVMNFNSEGWQLEFENNTIMSEDKAEHVKDAAKVLSEYCDIIAIRKFADLNNKIDDEKEIVLSSFLKYSTVPILNLESSTFHPLQGLADAITIHETKNKARPKIVLSWAPHPKSLPHAVPNSFIKMAKKNNFELIVSNPIGYDLNPEITKGINIIHDQKEAFINADFIYAKNWSSYENYGKVLINDSSWKIDRNKMSLTNNAKFMHCLPVRRNVVVDDDVIDSENSLVISQAENRIYSALIIIKKLIENER